MRKISVVVAAVFVVSALLVSTAFSVQAPTWAQGFPRLVEKNALLQWDLVKGASEYKVYRSEQRDKGLKLIATVKPNRHIDKDLPAGKTLFYYVTAVVDGKEGGRSVSAVITTPEEKVFVPLKKPELSGAHVKQKDATTYTVGLRWEPGAGSELVGYNLYRSKTKGKGYTLIGSTASDTFVDEDVKRGETYYYVATSVDSNFNETKYSNELTVEMPKVPEAREAAVKDEAPPTKMRSIKLLFTIPREDLDDVEKKRTIPPGNAQDVVVDEAVGHIYVTSYEYGGILVYDLEGRYQFGIRKDGVNGDVKFAGAESVELGPNGRLFFTAYTEPDLYAFDYSGRLIDTLNVDISHVKGKEKAKARLYGVAATPDGKVFVSDPVSRRIYGYDYLTKKRVVEIKPDEKKKIEFSGPSHVLYDSAGDLYFVDSGYSRLQIFGTDGKYKKTVGKKGLGAGLLYYPVGLANGDNGEVFSASGMSPNIQAFSTDGKFLYALCNEDCSGPPAVSDMRGIYVDSRKRLYVADGLAAKVVVFQLLDEYSELVPEEN